MGKRKSKTSAKDYTLEEVLLAVSNSYGIISRVAENMGCTWGTARKYVDMYPEALQLFEQEMERVLDLAESKVIKAINLDDVGTAKWLLSTKGKGRGYVSGVEVGGSGGGPIEVKTIVVVKPKSDGEG